MQFDPVVVRPASDFAHKIFEGFSVDPLEQKDRSIRDSTLIAPEEPWTVAERHLAASFEDLVQELQHHFLIDVLRLHRQAVASALKDMALTYGRPGTVARDATDSPRHRAMPEPEAVTRNHVVLDLDNLRLSQKKSFEMETQDVNKSPDKIDSKVDESDRSKRQSRMSEKSSDFQKAGTAGSCQTTGTVARMSKIGILAQKLHGRDVLTTPLQIFVTSTNYMVIICVMIVTQAVLMGWESHLQVVYEINRVSSLPADPVPEFFFVSNICLAAFFLLEVLFRIAVLREAFFFANDIDARAWNLFDLFVVLCCLPDLVPTYDFINFAFIRTVRLLRVIRVLHVARGVKELRKMVFAVIHSMSALFWLCTLMFILLYMFALVFMQGASSDLSDMTPQVNASDAGRRLKARGGSAVSECDETKLHPYASFDGLGQTMLSLFNVVVGNEDWTMVLKAVSDSSPFYGLWSLFFSVFFFFGFMNVATGLFVDKAMQIASQDRDMLLKEQVEKEKEEIEAMRELFQGADEDGDGSLTKAELRQTILHPDVRTWLSSIELDITDDIDNVLQVLDPDESGSIDAAEFYDTIGRFKGKARSADLVLCLMEARNFRTYVASLHDRLNDDLGQFHTLLRQLHAFVDTMHGDVLKAQRKYNV